MIKELEALKRLHEETKGNHNTSPFSNRSDYDLLKQALKRNIPLLRHGNDCPTCGFDFEYRDNYCGNCGQKIDWGDGY